MLKTTARTWQRRRTLTHLSITMLGLVFGQAAAAGLQSCHPAFGASIQQSAAHIEQLEGRLGCQLQHIKWFQNWDEAFNVDYARMLRARGKNLELSWQPRRLGPGGELQGVPYRRIAAGQEDAVLAAMVAGLRRLNAPVDIAFAPEMNGDWGVSQLGPDNTAADFVRAWQYIHRYFGQARVKVNLIWAPNILYPGSKSNYPALYPGDAYVAAVALDGYNWGTLRSFSAWKSFDETFGPSYRAVAALSRRPIHIGEIASTEEGGSKAAWIQGMCQALPRYPRLTKVTWFEMVAETDWRLTSSESSLQAMRQCVQPGGILAAAR
ncbi:endoglucanase (plasmid) [Deinococcus taeanensis]|uniref:glycoside hydrolase family 26 protein n=1 Tax=Deinococcus taeanensis TaxID=2737050 RepID=UPI001CDC6AAE|nr:glycosyl hydrolase [Deinococcus taeanensis]UBV45334.1 endoglucanase [Deinococcus taeanensis]